MEDKVPQEVKEHRRDELFNLFKKDRQKEKYSSLLLETKGKDEIIENIVSEIRG